MENRLFMGRFSLFIGGFLTEKKIMAFANQLLLSSSVAASGSYLDTVVGRQTIGVFEVVPNGATFVLTWKAKAAGTTGSVYDMSATNASSSVLSMTASVAGIYRVNTAGIEVYPNLVSVSGGTVVVYGTSTV